MKKLRWASDGDFWELDASTPRTLEGAARAVPGKALPLGLSRGTRLSRPNQIDFMQRFMAAPFLPSYTNHFGITLQRVLSIPFSENWSALLLGQFNMRKFLSSLKENGGAARSMRDIKSVGRLLLDKSLYALGFSSEILLSPDDTLHFSSDSYYAHNPSIPRKKAVYRHKFPNHNLTIDAAWPALFVDKETGDYWDVPFSMALDLASLPSDCGPSYHLCLHHNNGSPKQFQGDPIAQVPASLLPGFSAKCAFSYKKNVDIWRSKAQKLKMVQPYDLFLSDPHISASGTIGAALSANFGESSARLVEEAKDIKQLSLYHPALKSSLLGDVFASMSFTAQHGNFQRLFSDLTRFHARVEFPSGSKFLSGATQLAQDLLNSRQPSSEAIKTICPTTTLSLQQQIAGPFSFRVDSGVSVDFMDKSWRIQADQPVFAIEYALHVLCSAKAVAWYSPKHQEFMVELRFFET
ncbi:TRIGALACTOSYLDIACYLGLYCEROL 4, PIGMENT DEFECTIVE 320 [Hibiscus trionum]|uniref:TRIGALACTOSYLDIACYLGLYCEROL 4, PIGMENT DEFECTIVE 320 n=1 Tax=Hibiscus trionum TaxID=183268 RepID=A0A9W7LPV9_HIBTR|nr:TRIGALACTOSYLDIACYLGLYCEROL 4, PIGMENT DEFECTIVE 320 [Hibiscus trionum]